MSISGGLFHAHAAWRPLAALSDDEMLQLDALTKKLLGPGEDDAIDVTQKVEKLNATLVGSETQRDADA